MTDTQIENKINELLAQAKTFSSPGATKQMLAHSSALLAEVSTLRAKLPQKAETRTTTNREEEYRALSNYFIMNSLPPEQRGSAMNITTGSQGGFFVPFEYSQVYADITQAYASYDGLLDPNSGVTHVHRDNGRTLRVPSVDYLAVTSTATAENADVTDTTLPIIQSNLLSNPSVMYRTTQFGVSYELLQDAYEYVPKLMTSIFGLAMARGVSPTLVPSLMAGAASSGITTASPTAILESELRAVYLSLDATYRSRPNCAWVMSDSTWLKVRSLSDGTTAPGRPLFDITTGGEKSLYSKPVIISNSMAAATALNKPIVFGDVSLLVTTRTPFNVVSLKEPRAEFAQAVVFANQRWSSAVISSGTAKPLVYLSIHA
jgi:HK97 family phage major capsid protein